MTVNRFGGMCAGACLAGALLGVGAWLGGCEEKPNPVGAETSRPAGAPAPAGVTVPASLFLAQAPDAAQPVRAAKAAAKAGDRVVLVGKIGGTEDPFAPERAIFTIVDPAMPTCADNPADSCKTPWDYCCEDPDDVAASSATVQIVGPDGMPLKVTAQNAGGLRPMSTVTVVGTVAQRDEHTLVVNATGIHVEAPKPRG
ncbi:MAG TPA: hypothetical protein VD963_05425 [Phycisphaerales bacterium]|nr:hypothetical protein [Phycisphaerales bacterium]